MGKKTIYRSESEPVSESDSESSSELLSSESSDSLARLASSSASRRALKKKWFKSYERIAYKTPKLGKLIC